MRIAVIVPALNRKAPVVIATTLAVELKERGNEVSIFYFDDTVEMDLDPSISTRRISFFERIDWANFDVVHSHMIRPDAYVFFHKPFNSKVKAISTAHNYVYAELKNYYNSLVSMVFGTLWNVFWIRFDAIAVLSWHAKSYYESIWPSEKLHVCYNGRDLNIDYGGIGDNEAELCEDLRGRTSFVLGSYCNLIWRKRIDLLVEYLARNRSCGLIVIGDGPEKAALEKQARDLGVWERVLFLGYQPSAHLFNKYFDIFAMPSEDEGFGLSLIEAALHKKKIVCSNISVFREIFDENAVTFFGSGGRSLDSAIELARGDNAKPLKANEQAASRFAVSTMGSSYLRLFQQLAASR